MGKKETLEERLDRSKAERNIGQLGLQHQPENYNPEA